MKCATPIHVYTRLHARYHIVDQRVLDSVWPYFDPSRGKKTNYRSTWPLAQPVSSTLIVAANSSLFGTQVVPQI